MIIRIKYSLYCLLLLAFLLIMPRAGSFGASVVDRTEIDSLLKILPFARPVERTTLLMELANNYLSVSLDSSHEYARMALQNSIELQDNQAIGEAYKLLGNIGFYQGRFNDVLELYDSSLIMFRATGDSVNIIKIWNNMGMIYNNLGDYDKSIEFQLKSLEAKLKLNDSAGIAISYNNIGTTYYELKNFPKSYEFFNKALILSKKLNTLQSTQGILNNLGVIDQENGNFEKSIEYFLESIEYGKQTHYSKGISDSYSNLGKSYTALGDYSKALENLQKAIQFNKELGIENSRVYNSMAELYMNLDYYNQAIKYLLEGLKIAQANNQFNNLKTLFYNLSVCYEYKQDFQKAYRYHSLFHMYDDSSKNQMYSHKLEEIQMKYDLEKKQKEYEKLTLETQLALEQKDSDIKRRNYAIYSFIGGFVILVIFTLVLLVFARQKAHANKLLKKQNEEILRSDKIIKKINRALTDNEEMLRSIFDASPYPICVIDTEGIIIDCNNATYRILELHDKKELLNKPFESLILPMDVPKAERGLKLLMKSGQVTQDQFRIKRGKNSHFCGEISGGLIHDSSGVLKAFVLIITDVSERIGFINNLKQAKLDAEESDRLKTAFLANMSHEIRTPMNSIIGFSNLLMESDLEKDKKEEYLSHILQSSKLLLNLIDDIIDISKIEAGQVRVHLQEFNINPLVNDLFKVFHSSNRNPDVELRLNIPADSDDFTLHSDPLRLKQVLSNLIGNALKFTQNGFVELGYNIKKNGVNDRIEFYVRDSGIGIPKNKLQLIFERFRQVDDSRTRKFGGTGLGLAISRKLVELLEGSIWLESEEGKGTTFYCSLPFVSTEKFNVDDIEPFQASKYNWQGKTIMIAEDEDSNFELLKASIYRTKIKIVRAFNGEEAVDLIRNNGKVNLILMDIRMPKMNGYEATRVIKSFKPELPVVSITAYAMSEDETKSIEAGCDMYISKPIRPAKLLSIIDGFLKSG
ncbi:MAG: tetratricopeptide repeat protein [Bacteroidales bacterium]